MRQHAIRRIKTRVTRLTNDLNKMFGKLLNNLVSIKSKEFKRLEKRCDKLYDVVTAEDQKHEFKSSFIIKTWKPVNLLDKLRAEFKNQKV